MKEIFKINIVTIHFYHTILTLFVLYFSLGGCTSLPPDFYQYNVTIQCTIRKIASLVLGSE